MGGLANRKAWRQVPGSAAQRDWLKRGLRDYEAAVGLAPLSERYVIADANQADLLGERERARALFAQAVAIDPASAQAIAGLGVVAFEDGDRDAAAAYLLRARAIDPNGVNGPRAGTRSEVRVALDAQLTVGTATGIGEYVRGLADALRARKLDLAELREESLNPWRFDRRVLWDQFVLPRRARESGADLLHCASGTVPRIVSLPVVVTVHDVAWLDVQRHAPAYARYYFGKFSLHGYRRAKRIVVDSEFSRGALLARLGGFDPERVSVVYPGVAAEFVNLARERGDGRTILSVGTIEPRKNLELLVRALTQLPGARVVAVGPQTPYARECAFLAQQLDVADRLEMPGYVTRETLLALHASCAVVAVPSAYEGFGYAAAQALCAGMPCVVSDRTSLPEVSGGDAPIVELERSRRLVRAPGRGLRGDLDASAAGARARSAAAFLLGRRGRSNARGLCELRSTKESASKSANRVRPARRCRRRARRPSAAEGSNPLRASSRS